MLLTASKSYKLFIVRTGCFRDDRTGYLIGDSVISGTHEAGEVLKTIIPVNIQIASAGQVQWTEEPVEDGQAAKNIVTAPTQINYNAIAFSSPYDGFVGGSYSPTFTNASNYPYARLLNDQGGQFSFLIWYDRIGRTTLMQDSKQHNYKRQAYTYTLFDALNRIIETGQKTENVDTANNFNKIFGDTVMGFYNPNVVNPNKYLTWIKDNTGPRTEVTHSYYDVQNILPKSLLVQQQLRNRTATITYSDTLRSDSTKFDNATHFSYDVHGNTSTLIQDDSVIGVSGQRYKRVDYQYDLISDNLNELDYESDSLDQYHHKYSYDADNRITQVQTSKDSVMWDNDANYFYYAHDKLARIELGDQQVQGMDYAYTLQGWIKGVNSDLLDSNRDMGHDGLIVPGNLNRYFARDAMGYTLKYFKGQVTAGIFGDYDAINVVGWNDNVSRFEARDYKSDLMNTRHDLFNSNITAMVTNIQKPTEYTSNSTVPTALPQGNAYSYDQLDRMIDMKAFQNLDTDNVWGNSGTYNGLYHNWLTYDANGNILTQKRADSVSTGEEVFDSLTYQYNIQGGRTLQNRLYHINDAANVSTIHNDIKDEGTFKNSTEHDITNRNNYRYNENGELARDSAAGLDTIIWTRYGKPWKIKKHNGDSLLFAYGDASHYRVRKEYKPLSGNPITTFYVNDPKGNTIAIYTKQNTIHGMSFLLTEREINGKSRLGIENTQVQLIAHTPVSLIDTFNHYLMNKQYELGNHLGNVLAVVSDRKIPRPNANVTNIDHYEADVISSNDYYPFGWYEPGRNFNSFKYRYGFNKKEKDDETYGSGNEYDFGARLYDPRLGKFLSPDTMIHKFPMWSPYLFAADNPVRLVDTYGGGPGDLFTSPDEAAHDWGKTYNGKSISQNREYASTIYEVNKEGKTYYSYTTPNKGPKPDSKSGEASSGFSQPKHNEKVVAEIHSHAAWDSKLAANAPGSERKDVDANENFSVDDIMQSSLYNNEQGIPSYVCTPEGTLKKYDPSEDAKDKRPYDERPPLYSDLPSDPKDPNRKNSVSPSGKSDDSKKSSEDTKKSGVQPPGTKSKPPGKSSESNNSNKSSNSSSSGGSGGN